MQIGSNCLTLPAEAIRVSTFQSRDAVEHAGRLHGWNLSMEQLSQGTFSGRRTEFRLDHMQIMRETTTQALMKRGSAWQGSLIFSLPMAALGDGYFNGHLLSCPSVLFNDGADVPGLLTPKILDVVIVAVERKWLLDCLASLNEFKAADCLGVQRPLHCRVDLSANNLLTMQRLLQAIFDGCEPRGGALEFVASRNAVEELVLQVMAGALTAGSGFSLDAATSRRKIADRVREFVLMHAEDPPSVLDLCRYVGVSRRSLQYCFQEAFGVSPFEFLQAMRLNAVRRELQVRTAGGRPVSISDVAGKWGFWHWSRFAASYRAQFGELPSQTLRNGAETRL